MSTLFYLQTKEMEYLEFANTSSFRLLKNYTRVGCEFECAVDKALDLCKCLPWYLPNDFTEYPMCEMFGLQCFEEIISDESYYKKCPARCLSECKSVSISFFSTEKQLDTDILCNAEMDKYLESFQYNYQKFETYDYLTSR